MIREISWGETGLVWVLLAALGAKLDRVVLESGKCRRSGIRSTDLKPIVAVSCVPSLSGEGLSFHLGASVAKDVEVTDFKLKHPVPGSSRLPTSNLLLLPRSKESVSTNRIVSRQ